MELPCTNRVEMWPIDRPQPNPDNAKEHPEDQVLRIAKSVEIHGLNRTILVDQNGVILAGHGLWLALRSLGYQEVPVQVLSHLTDSQKQTFLIADNQTGVSSWDEQKLGLTLQKLERELVELDVLGFRPQELDRLLADLQSEELPGDMDAIPEMSRQVVTVPGDLWISDAPRFDVDVVSQTAGGKRISVRVPQEREYNPAAGSQCHNSVPRAGYI